HLRSAKFTFDKTSNLVTALDPAGAEVACSYAGPYDRIATVTDPNDNLTTLTYDDRGNLVALTYPDGTQEKWGYDAQGNVTASTNGREQSVTYTHDAAGRLTSKEYPDGSTVAYVHDNHGNLTAATDAKGTIHFTYDGNDYLTRIDYPDGKFLAYTYDTAGRRTSMSDQFGHGTVYHYDALGRLESIANELGAPIDAYEYDDLGRLAKETKGNGAYTTYEYDAAGELVHLVNYTRLGSVLSRFDYEYDAAGNVSRMTSLDGQWSYTYDLSGQLIHAVLQSVNPNIPNQDMGWEYDAAGNRVSAIANGVTETYTTNNLNQYTAVGGVEYRYDADGNLVAKIDGTDVWTYQYDVENRLVAVTGPEDTWTYEYDALGNRAATTHDGFRTEFVVDPFGMGDVVAEYRGGAGPTYYAHGLGLAAQLSPGSAANYYSFDMLGSTSVVTAANGQVLDQYSYDPFGNILSKIEFAPNPFEFVGRLGVMEAGHVGSAVSYDVNGLTFMRARFYDPLAGRFISQDPIMWAGLDVNLYRYAWDNPVLYVDPSGLQVDDQAESVAKELRRKLGAAADMGAAMHDARKLAKGEQIKLNEKGYSPADTATLGNRKAANIFVETGHILDCGSSSCRGGTPVSEGSTPWDDVKRGARYVVQIVFGIDPNAKSNAQGYGVSGYVRGDGLLSYRIDFENDADATAPAQRVVVSDQLADTVDLATFELTQIGFGDQIITVPAGSQHFQTTVPFEANGKSVEVQIEAGLDAASGRVFAVFQTIDPAIDLPPDVMTGFLPPEDGTGRGMGFVSYVIRPKSGLTTGTEIRNVALIQFDFGETIATNQIDPHDPGQGTDAAKECLNTIDAGTPESNVVELPRVSVTTEFTVNWTGQDDEGGSGIGTYDVYVSDDGDGWEKWQDRTPETSAAFVGEPGHTYRFYSIARDNVAWEEASPTPDTFDTLTTVMQVPWQNPVNQYDVYGQDGVWPLDVLLIVNYINAHPGESSVPPAPQVPPPFYNVDGDDGITAQDVLLVINYINSQSAAAGEAEATATPTEAEAGAIAGARDRSAVWDFDAPASDDRDLAPDTSARDQILAGGEPFDPIVWLAVGDRGSDRSEAPGRRVGAGSSDLDLVARDEFAVDGVWGELVDAVAAQW
ncbi:MAG TPA: RHS repeat-associated core domain-containing protein, partial [Candidatus Anammoximicrobium sp.]|nr:RHS repeat-associated core domain-containing protein [Candidatus Anammoximicrobium sp.]